nr:hypothetical protein I308_04835 [Cryptococcus tetragattii IND107]
MSLKKYQDDEVAKNTDDGHDTSTSVMGIEESLFKVDDKIDEVVVVVQDTEEIVIEISE